MYPQTPLPNSKFPKADSRLFEVPWGTFGNSFLPKAMEIVAKIADEQTAREWLHNNGISNIKIKTPFWTINTQEQNFWQVLSDTLTPIVAKAAGAVPIIGTVFTKAYNESQNPTISLLSKEDYQGEALYQSVMNGPAVKSSVVPPTAIAGIIPTSSGQGLGLGLLAMVFFFSFSLVKRNVEKCYFLNPSLVLTSLRRLLCIRTFQRLLFCLRSIVLLLKRQLLLNPYHHRGPLLIPMS